MIPIYVGWSDIYGLHYDSAEDKAGMDSSADRINKIIAAEVEKKDIKPSQIVVAGTKTYIFFNYKQSMMTTEHIVL